MNSTRVLFSGVHLHSSFSLSCFCHNTSSFISLSRLLCDFLSLFLSTALFLSLCICQCLWLGVVFTDMNWVCDHWSIYFYSDIWKQREVSTQCLDDEMKCEASSLTGRICSPVSGRSGAVSLSAAWLLHLWFSDGKKEQDCLRVY